MDYIYIGKIVNTHGIKGEIRILSDFEYKTYVFKVGMNIYIGNDKNKEVITFHRVHKGYDMITLKGYHNINDVLKYKDKKVYVNQQELELGDNDYLDHEFVNKEVYMGEKYLGVVTEVLKTKANSILIVMNKDKKTLIPKVDEIVTLKDNKVLVTEMEGLIDEN